MSNPFDPSRYSPQLVNLLRHAPEMPLDAGQPASSLRQRLENLRIEDLFDGQPPSDGQMAQCCLAGLWLRFNFLEEAHRISQNIPTPTGSYWHGIMHRREGDYWNSKYWMRRVGTHPIFQDLAREARQLSVQLGTDSFSEYLRTLDGWDPFRFVDFVEACVQGRSAAEQLALAIQQREWELLFDYCYQHARER